MEHLQALALRQELAYMVGITVPQTGIPETYTIVVDSHRAIHHLVEPVTIKISNIQRVVALSGIGAMLLAILAGLAVVGVEAPTLGQDRNTVLYTVVPSLDDAVGIYPTSEDNGGEARLVETAHTDTE